MKPTVEELARAAKWYLTCQSCGSGTPSRIEDTDKAKKELKAMIVQILDDPPQQPAEATVRKIRGMTVKTLRKTLALLLESESHIEISRHDIRRFADELEAREAELEAAEQNARNLVGEVEGLRATERELTAGILDRDRTIDTANARIAELEGDLRIEKRINAELGANVAHENTQNRLLRDKLADATARAEGAEVERDRLVGTVASLEKERDGLKNEIDVLEHLYGKKHLEPGSGEVRVCGVRFISAYEAARPREKIKAVVIDGHNGDVHGFERENDAVDMHFKLGSKRATYISVAGKNEWHYHPAATDAAKGGE